MKNVAGYDMARVLAGSLGTLGVLVDVSLKVLPRPVAERTLRFEIDEATAIRQLNEWGGQPLPISASAWLDGVLWLRLSGARAAVDAAQARLGGSVVSDADRWWTDLREQRHPFFQSGAGACAVASGGAADDAAAGAGRHADRMARRPALGATASSTRRDSARGLLRSAVTPRGSAAAMCASRRSSHSTRC